MQIQPEPAPLRRRRLPDVRRAVVHKFRVDSWKGYLNVGLFDDGTPGEVFCHLSKSGSTTSGMMNAFCIAVSMALQYGVPLETLANKFVGQRFEPRGLTTNPEIPEVSSITDYIFRWMVLKFPTVNAPQE